MKKKNFKKARESMVAAQIKARGIKDERILEAMRSVPRHVFVPEDMVAYAYNDEPLPIGEGQTISQPYIVAYMTEVLRLRENDRVLEIGTGSGYQAAILAELAREVFTVELVETLSRKAEKRLKDLGYTNIFFKVGDGTYGWKEFAPFDAIIVTAAPEKVPQVLIDQLGTEGRMVVPVGSAVQELVLVVKGRRKIRKKKLLPVRFVPLLSTH
ncbi:MAG: protein-L-isoaspartate(D-aspartate) O-methyltransferase [Candidatus Aminicenantales bacterium]